MPTQIANDLVFVNLRGRVNWLSRTRELDVILDTPLHLSAMGGHLEASTFLLEEGCRADDLNRFDLIQLVSEGELPHINVILLFAITDSNIQLTVLWGI